MMLITKKNIDLIFKMIEDGNTETSLIQVSKMLDENTFDELKIVKILQMREENILLKSRFYLLEKQKRLGIIDDNKYSIERNKITLSLLELLNLLSKEVDTAPSKSPILERATAPVATNLFLLLLPIFVFALLISIGVISYYKFIKQSTPVENILIGKVFDFKNNNLPIIGASVEIISDIGKYTHTDSRGSFAIELEGTGKKIIEIQVTHPKYETQIFKIQIQFNNKEEKISIDKFLLIPKG